MKPEETIDFHIRWAWAKISKAYNSEAAKNGGTMAVGYVLLNIDKDGTPSTQLGPRMGMEPTSLSRVLKSMENSNLIKRKQDNGDKRVVKIMLTPKGKDMREISKNAVINFNEQLKNTIAPEKLDTFFEVMREINQYLDTKPLERKPTIKIKKVPK
jgi:MarR family transcriptional regulator, organic hydroperoxide resistance regulator